MAVADLNRAMTIRPDRPATYLNLAVAYMERAGDLDRAVANLTEALELQPGYAAAYVNRAGAYVARGAPGDLDRALEDLDQALEAQPELASAYLNRGNAYLARGSPGDVELALLEFSRAIDLAPDSPMAFFNRGLVYSELGDWDRSLDDLRRAQMLSPRQRTFNSTLCWQLGVVGDPEEALVYCDQAIAADPTGLTRDSRGLVYAVMGRTTRATADFEAFLAWVDASPKDSCRRHYRPSRQAWLKQLQAERNPFNAATLRDHRVRPAAAGQDPC